MRTGLGGGGGGGTTMLPMLLGSGEVKQGLEMGREKERSDNQ
jgi:hypothetical protein